MFCLICFVGVCFEMICFVCAPFNSILIDLAKKEKVDSCIYIEYKEIGQYKFRTVISEV